ncbi:MAG: hypothetical protein B6226_01965 [Candidatus Cloacimonetes bacterium 4572_65]|nr:MAG: hypothetical protein B6226_01965 [Candidatus Cloacimonetes bacterium 4572_65]
MDSVTLTTMEIFQQIQIYRTFFLAISPTTFFFMFLYLHLKRKKDSFYKAVAKAAVFAIFFVLLNLASSIKYFIISFCINAVIILAVILRYKQISNKKNN